MVREGTNTAQSATPNPEEDSGPSLADTHQESNATDESGPPRASWRERYKLHPAVELIPEASPEERVDLRMSIEAHGLLKKPALWQDAEGEEFVLAGRTRLDALERLGIEINSATFERVETKDPWAYALALDLARRHLSFPQRREAAEKLVAARPELSNRQLERLSGVSHPVIAKIRKKLEDAGEVQIVSTSVDSRGRKQPRTRTRQPKVDPGQAPESEAKRAQGNHAPDRAKRLRECLGRMTEIGDCLEDGLPELDPADANEIRRILESHVRRLAGFCRPGFANALAAANGATEQASLFSSSRGAYGNGQ
jgi:ParB-like chromosome segregation protein Spo0J